jgi:hypothetical protein
MYNANIRAQVLKAYGGACNCCCCGEETPEFLAVDHIHNNGSLERREYGLGTGTKFYLWLRKQGFPKNRYQLLCHNCNFAKFRYGGCPHQKEVAA